MGNSLASSINRNSCTAISIDVFDMYPANVPHNAPTSAHAFYRDALQTFLRKPSFWVSLLKLSSLSPIARMKPLETVRAHEKWHCSAIERTRERKPVSRQYICHSHPIITQSQSTISSPRFLFSWTVSRRERMQLTTLAMLIWTLAWSVGLIRRPVALHLRGT